MGTPEMASLMLNGTRIGFAGEKRPSSLVMVRLGLR